MKQRHAFAAIFVYLLVHFAPIGAAAQEVILVPVRDQPTTRGAVNVSIEFTFGLSLNDNRFRIDTGGGTFQDFTSTAGSGVYSDLRFVFDDLVVLGEGGDSANGRTSLYGGIGFQTYQGHVDFFENVGGRLSGARNFAYEGTTRLDSPFIFGGINFASDRLWNPFTDLGGEISLGLGAGVPPTATSQNGGGFRAEGDEVPLFVDAFYKFKVSDNISIAPGFILLFNANGVGDDEVLIGAIRTKFKF